MPSYFVVFVLFVIRYYPNYLMRREPSSWIVEKIRRLLTFQENRSRFEGQSTVLRIDDVRLEDEGLYKCEIAVQNSPKIYVEVKVEPEVNGARTWSKAASVTTASQISTLLVSLLLALCFVWTVTSLLRIPISIAGSSWKNEICVIPIFRETPSVLYYAF